MTPAKGKTDAQENDPAVEATELRAEIDETRADLGDTVEQLSQKADVKAQAQAKVDETKQHTQAKIEQVKGNPAPVAGVAAGIGALLLLLWLIRRR